MSASLIIGLKVGNSQATVTVRDNGWVCGDTAGDCDPNYNVTCCTWGPGSNCSDGGCQ